MRRTNLLRLARLVRRTRPAWADQRGVAAIEFALFATFLSVAIINVTDVSIYIYQRMQAENATEVGAQAAWKALRPQPSAGLDEVSRIGNGRANRGPQHLTRLQRIAADRLAIRGVLLRQRGKRPAVYQRHIHQARRLYRGGDAEPATGRLHQGPNDVSLCTAVPRHHGHRLFSYPDYQNRAYEVGLIVKNILNSAWGNDRGTTAVEFAIVAPVFIALLVGTFGLCLALFLAGSLHYAVEEGARCASVKTLVCSNPATTIAYTQNHYFGPSASPTFTYAAAACGNSVSASINYSVNLGFGNLTIPINATACFPS
jgi:Flp pilus assembly protein TadG